MELKTLQIKRQNYEKVMWLSSRGDYTFIVDMDDNYLQNVIKKCVEKQLIAERIKWMPEAGIYEGYTYSEWLRMFKVEYLYRKALEEEKEMEDMFSLHEARRDYRDMVGAADPYDFCF